MSDLIRRDDAIRMLDEYIKPFVGLIGDMGSSINGAREIIKSIPTAEPKVGEWITSENKNTLSIMHTCNQCGYKKLVPKVRMIGDSKDALNYCPNCGARMERSE